MRAMVLAIVLTVLAVAVIAQDKAPAQTVEAQEPSAEFTQKIQTLRVVVSLAQEAEAAAKYSRAQEAKLREDLTVTLKDMAAKGFSYDEAANKFLKNVAIPTPAAPDTKPK